MRLILKLAIAAAALTLCGAAVSGSGSSGLAPGAPPMLSGQPCPTGMKTMRCTALLIVTATLR